MNPCVIVYYGDRKFHYKEIWSERDAVDFAKQWCKDADWCRVINSQGMIVFDSVTYKDL